MRVMAPVSLGEESGMVLRMACELAGPRGLVMVAHVATPDWGHADAAARMLRECGEQIQVLVDRYEVPRFTAHIERGRTDEPGHTLARMANDLHADIVVLHAGAGKHGHTVGLVVRDARCSVVVLRAPSAETLVGQLTWRT